MTAILDRASLARRWLPFGIPEGDVRLFCLPHAGGSASAFRPWTGRLGQVAICPVQPPGREIRLRETPHLQMTSLIEELADVVLDTGDEPYAIYGHSLGALVGFELVREIRRRSAPGPLQLIVSGCPAPQDLTHDTDPQVAGMTQGQVVNLLRALGGTPEWLLTDPTALQIILPPFTADFALKQSYRYAAETPLSVPITAIGSTHDPRAGAAMMGLWREQTTSTFAARTMHGGHFAVLEQPTTTLAYLADVLTPWSAFPAAEQRLYALRGA